MALLKKINATTLVETLLASVIILIIFLMASTTLNNVFLGTIKKDHSILDNRVKELEYMTRNKALLLPFNEENSRWHITVEKKIPYYKMSVLHKASGKENEYLIEQ